jgi:8-amino-7-oxononanoate synthase
MAMNLYERIEYELSALEANGNLRQLPEIEHNGKMVNVAGKTMLNLSSNDYLGIACRTELRDEFMRQAAEKGYSLTSSSSRLLTGNYTIYRRIEERLARMFGAESALVLSCGYHVNSGVLPSICDSHTLVLADKLVHASMIDGIRLTGAKCIRYRHNNYEQIERLLADNHKNYNDVIIMVESVYSMDGDITDLRRLVDMKRRFGNVLLYVDEAHAFGIFGENGLGLAEEQGCINDIDILIGTFGKALASAGAYIICNRKLHDYLVNRMRTLIFTTALPPLCVEWTDFLLERLSGFKKEREHLRSISAKVLEALRDNGYICPSASQIIPLMAGESHTAIAVAKLLQRKGFYLLPVRPPTVPEGTSRIRISLTAALTDEEVKRLIDAIPSAMELKKISDIER